MTPAQCRAARALLDWTLTAAATAAGVGRATLERFEAERRGTTPEVKQKLTEAFRNSGVIFNVDAARIIKRGKLGDHAVILMLDDH